MGEIYTTMPSVVLTGDTRLLTQNLNWEIATGRGRSHGMDGIRDLLEAARANGLVTRNFRGLLNIVIGRTITSPDGAKISSGVTWRELAALLKAIRYDPEYGQEVGADPATLSPRDRARYWYSVIALARVDSPQALEEASRLIGPFKQLGFIVGPPPGGMAPPPSAKNKPTVREKLKPEEKQKKKKK